MKFRLFDTKKNKYVEDEPYGLFYRIVLDGSVTVYEYNDKYGMSFVGNYKDRFDISIIDEEKETKDRLDGFDNVSVYSIGKKMELKAYSRSQSINKEDFEKVYNFLVESEKDRIKNICQEVARLLDNVSFKDLE